MYFLTYMDNCNIIRCYWEEEDLSLLVDLEKECTQGCVSCKLESFTYRRL